MTRSQQIFQVLKEELTALGYWKNLPRGNPQKAYQVSRKGKKNAVAPL